MQMVYFMQTLKYYPEISFIANWKGRGTLKERPYSTYYARLLGGFSFSRYGQEVPIKGNLRSKYLQIFAMLLKAGKEGISKERLMVQIAADTDNREKMMNNLRQQIHVLRRTLITLGIPEGELVVSVKGRYYFSRDQDIITDTGQIDELYRELRSGKSGEEERMEILREICHTYSGEFLPMLSGEEWAAVEGAYYQNIFFECLKELCELLKKQKNYDEMLELCSKASQLHPYDEWQAVEIDCLMAKNRYMDALKVYEKATEVFYEEFGVSPFDSVMAKYRSRQGQLLYTSGVLSEIKGEMMKHDSGTGAYYCSYPSFLDVYHLMVRLKERQDLKLSLMICTLNSGQQDSEINEVMEEFQLFISENLRRTDVFTRYSPNQFLILLFGSDEPSSEKVVDRLQRKWKLLRGDLKRWANFAVEEIKNPDEREAV